MNRVNYQLELKIEDAVRFLSDVMPSSADRKKPLLLHVLRVGMYLYSKNYSDDIVIAGFYMMS